MTAKRTQYLLTKSSSVIDRHFLCAEDPYVVQSNTNGYLNFGTAENYLMDTEVKHKLNEWRHSKQADSVALHYTDIQGIEELRAAFSQFLCHFNGINVNDIDQITISTGVGTLLHMLSHVMLDENESMLTLVPAYSGFFNAIGSTFSVNLHTSHSLNEAGINFEILERDIQQCEKLKVLLINHPHNPTGYLFNETEIKQLIELAKKYQLDIISDEVYANSVYGDNPFISFLDDRFNALDYQEHVHLVYGISKDLCLSGFRLGCFYTRNQQLNKAMSTFAFYHSVSSIAQTCTTYLLNDIEWCQQFITSNCQRLKQTQHRIVTEMSQYGIEFFPSQAGIFLWADFSQPFELTSLEKEKSFNLALFQQTKINMASGHNYHAIRTGMQRICFAKDDDMVSEMLKRFAIFYQNITNQNG